MAYYMKVVRNVGRPANIASCVDGEAWNRSILLPTLSHGHVLLVRGGQVVAGILRETPMEKALFAVDELTGLITAVALVRPSKDIRDVKVRSVRKKWKDRSFAAGVDRADVEEGAADLGIELNEHIAVVLEAMQGIAGKLGLAGPEG